MAVREEVTLVISQLVLTETRRNLFESAPAVLAALDRIIEHIPFEIVYPTKREVVTAASHVALKDAPIVAAALKAKVDMLVTLDKKHLLNHPELERYIRAAIITPADAVARLNRTRYMD